MSIIQSIRDKASWLIIILVVLSLIGFILMDSSISRWTFGGSDAFTIGKVNGKEISYASYQAAYDEVQKRLSQQMGGDLDDQDKLDASNQVWQSLVEAKLAEEAYERLGIAIHKNELKSILLGEVRLDALAMVPAFSNPATGELDPMRLRQYLQSMQENAKQNPEAAQALENFTSEIKKSALRQKFMSGLVGSEIDPKWLIKLTEERSTQYATASVIEVPFYQLDIDKVTLAKEDIEPYTKKYALVEPAEEARQVDYVVFDASPTSQDSADLLASLQRVKDEFATTANPLDLIAKTDATLSYLPHIYLFSKDLEQFFSTQARSITSMKVGATMGPFIDGASTENIKHEKKGYHLVRMVGKRSVPQSVKVRHILVAINATRTEEAAKTMIDSVVLKLKNGADFATLVNQYSDDEGSKAQGGAYTFEYKKDFTSLDSTFGREAFYSPVHTKKLIKSAFGYHWIEVLEQKDFLDGYNIAMLTSPIEPSVNTETSVFNQANQFSVGAQQKDFLEIAKSKGYEVFSSTSFSPNTPGALPKISYSKELVRWAFKKEEKEGAVSAPFQVGKWYVVGHLKKIVPKEAYEEDKVNQKFGIVAKSKKLVEKAKSEAASKASFTELASHYKVSPFSISVTAVDVVAKGDSGTHALNAPELVGVLFNSGRGTQAWKQPILGKSAIYFVNDIAQQTKPSSFMSLAFFKQYRQRNAIDKDAIYSLLDKTKLQDFRYKF